MTRRINAPLTSIRFFAAMHVVSLHFVASHLEHAPKPIREFFMRGAYGVTLFFVLSGFILAYNYMPAAADRTLELPKFYSARFARVYPIYFLSHLAALPIVVSILRHQLAMQAMLALLLRQSLLRIAMLQAWFPHLYYEVHWNTVAWSVSVEAFFYLVYPTVASRIGRMDKAKCVSGTILCLLVLSAIHYAYHWQNPDRLASGEAPVEQFWNAVVMFNPVALLPQFLVGLFAGKLYLDRVKERGETESRSAGLIVCGLAVAITLLLAGFLSDQESIVRPAATGLFAVLIFYVASSGGVVRKVLSWAPLVVLGEASYTMYLIQRPLSEYILILFRKRYGEGPSPYLPIFLVALLVTSFVVWKWVETPLRIWVKRVLDARFSPTVAVGSAGN